MSQAEVQLTSGVPFLSDKDLEAALDEANVSPAVNDAVIDENAEARIYGLRAALAVLGLFADPCGHRGRRLPKVQPNDPLCRRIARRDRMSHRTVCDELSKARSTRHLADDAGVGEWTRGLGRRSPNPGFRHKRARSVSTRRLRRHRARRALRCTTSRWCERLCVLTLGLGSSIVRMATADWVGNDARAQESGVLR